MSALQPFSRIIDLTTGTTIATTGNFISWTVTYDLDKPGQLEISVPAGDPGDAGGLISDGFAQALLLAASDVTGAEPKPLLLEFSLDGGAHFESRMLVTNPQRTLAVNQRTITVSGMDLCGQALAAAVVERVTFSDIALQDVLAGNPGHVAGGTISPLNSGGIDNGILASGEHIPYLSGILNVPWTTEPGVEGWASGQPALLTVTAVVNPDIKQQSTYLDVNAATVLSALTTLANRLAGSALQQEYGHFVLDPSSPALNLSGTTNFSPAPTAVGMSCVFGHKGTSSVLAFDASSSADVSNEATTARVLLDSARIETDDAVLMPAANFVGGRSLAGFPTNSSITSLALVNGSTPAISTDRTAWSDCLPVVGLKVDDDTGYLAFTILDSVVRPYPLSPSGSILSQGFDAGNSSTHRSAGLYVGTQRGVYYTQAASGLSLLPGATQWYHLAGMEHEVVRLHIDQNEDNPVYNVVWALVKGAGTNWDGVWRYDSATSAWSPLILHPGIADLVTTDFETYWVLHDNDPTHIYQYNIADNTPRLTVTIPNGRAYGLARAITVASAGPPRIYSADSIWVLVDGGVQPAYYLATTTDDQRALGSSLFDTWGASPWYNPNIDTSLIGPNGETLHVYTVVGPGITVDVGFGGPLVNLLVGTDLGIYWSGANLGDPLHWRKGDLGGLGNYAIRRIAMGEGQTVLGKAINRMYATTDDDLLYSNDSGRTWDSIKGRGTTGMGTHVSNLYYRREGTLPDNTLRTFGSTEADGVTPMTVSPLGSGVPHYNIPAGDVDEIPPGLFLERYLDGRLDFQWRLRKVGAHLPGQDMSSLPEIQTGPAVSADRSSAACIQVARRFIQQHSVSKTQITVQSTFTTQEAGLRKLRATHKCSLVGEVAILDISSANEAVTTEVMNFDGSEDFWCISHKLSKGPGMTVQTETVLAPRLLPQPISEADLSSALSDEIKAVSVWR